MITTLAKKRVIRDFDKLERSFQKQVLKSFPEGVGRDAITYLTIQGKTVRAIPFETEDTYYLLRLNTAVPSIRKRKAPVTEEYLPLEDDDVRNSNTSSTDDEEPIDYGSDFQSYEQDEDPEYYD